MPKSQLEGVVSHVPHQPAWRGDTIPSLFQSRDAIAAGENIHAPTILCAIVAHWSSTDRRIFLPHHIAIVSHTTAILTNIAIPAGVHYYYFPAGTTASPVEPRCIHQRITIITLLYFDLHHHIELVRVTTLTTSKSSTFSFSYVLLHLMNLTSMVGGIHRQP